MFKWVTFQLLLLRIYLINRKLNKAPKEKARIAAQQVLKMLREKFESGTLGIDRNSYQYLVNMFHKYL